MLGRVVYLQLDALVIENLLQFCQPNIDDLCDGAASKPVEDKLVV
jgi:hypothetical protein